MRLQTECAGPVWVVSPRGAQWRAQIYSAFIPRYRQAFVERSATTLTDEVEHLQRMQTLLAPASTLLADDPSLAPTAAEVTTHALVAWNNISRGVIRWRSWPAMPRHRRYKGQAHEVRNDWNVGISSDDTSPDTTSHERLVRFSFGRNITRAQGATVGRFVDLGQAAYPMMLDVETLAEALCAEPAVLEYGQGAATQQKLTIISEKLVKSLTEPIPIA